MMSDHVTPMLSQGVKLTLADGTELEHFEAVNRGAEGSCSPLSK